MAERVLSPTTYLATLGALVLLTVLTVGVSFIPMPGIGHIICGLVIALVKASLVVLIFMHALVGPRLNWVVIAAALFWTILLFSLTLSDYFTRGLVPYTPGH